MSAGQDFTKLDRLERELKRILREQGVEIPQFGPAPAAPDADAERAALRADMDRRMGLEALTPQARREGATLTCGYLQAPARTNAPERVNRATTQRTRAAAGITPERASYLAAMDSAMGTGKNELGVRMEGATQVFHQGT